MPDRPNPNRASEYRARAEEVRAKAKAVTNEKARAELLQVADVWERMAHWEEWQAKQLGAHGTD
jgi:hypothetical protein